MISTHGTDRKSAKQNPCCSVVLISLALSAPFARAINMPTALKAPMQKIKMVPKRDMPSAPAASAVGPIQPIMTVSMNCMPLWARKAAIKGKATVMMDFNSCFLIMMQALRQRFLSLHTWGARIACRHAVRHVQDAGTNAIYVQAAIYPRIIPA